MNNKMGAKNLPTNRLPIKTLRFDRQINVGMIGMGTVGTGVAKILQEQGEALGVSLRKVAVLDPNKQRSYIPHSVDIVKNAREVTDDPNIQIVVEVMGGTSKAVELMLRALTGGKSVVTANKAALAYHMQELFNAAKTGSADLRFEASVGGGIPIMEIIRQYQEVDKITGVSGILNGTTNYILTKMTHASRRGKTLQFDKVLKEAQNQGFAEADPTSDIEGHDSAYKLAVLSALIFNTPLDPSAILTTGITGITPIDIEFADEYREGYVIKLLANARMVKGSLSLEVSPRLVSKSNPLSAVDGVFNAITIETERAGSQTFVGRGAGEMPTASAIVRDLKEVAFGIRHGFRRPIPGLDSLVKYANPDDIKQAGYLRVDLIDQPGSLLQVADIWAKHGLNIGNSIQREEHTYQVHGSIAKPYGDSFSVVPDINTFRPVPLSSIRSALEDLYTAERVYGSPFFIAFQD